MIAEARQRGAEADKRGAEAVEAAEKGLKNLYTTYKNRTVSDELLQQLIKAKNSARNLQNKNIYAPSDDIEIILKRIEQLEKQSNQPIVFTTKL
jgi:predicted outer membrane protein